MLLYLHITVAIAGLIISGYNLAKPSAVRQLAGYITVAVTFLSGTVLIVSTNAALVPACLSGLGYLSVVSLCLFLSRRRLAITP